MVNSQRAARTADRIAHARQEMQAFTDEGTMGGKLSEISPEAARDTMDWAREQMEFFQSVDAGTHDAYSDADEKPGSIQTNFYYKTKDAVFDGESESNFSHDHP